MSTNLPNVTLDIRSSNCGAPPFSHTVEREGGTSNPGALSYTYQYAGGSDGSGNESAFVGQGEQEFLVTLIADRRYHLKGVEFAQGNTQLSKHDQDTYKVTIKDADTAAEDDYYKILVKDTGNGDCAFYCDPRVSNINPD